MKLPIYQVDAFAEKIFKGNPAAVCPLESWLPDEVMQLIAQENNLSETAFIVATVDGYHIRWFTPVAEVDLCGHATLAAAYVLFTSLGIKEKTIKFSSKSGELKVTKNGSFITMNFPSQPPKKCETPSAIIQAFDIQPLECLQAEDYVVVYRTEEEVSAVKPNFNLLNNLNLRGVIITAESKQYDFVARYFAPKYGINEDPVTGSAYTQLVPYWSNRLSKKELHAKQLSSRGGELFCELLGNRVNIAGRAVKYMEGIIEIKT
ncbi:MAG: PhzF family phenazine biosynthesis protein [Gammaproteobacteria bacterium]|nr:PhzF family phenazine biosynthesis protein [Gammaproteobacteria bacterium]